MGWFRKVPLGIFHLVCVFPTVQNGINGGLFLEIAVGNFLLNKFYPPPPLVPLLTKNKDKTLVS